MCLPEAAALLDRRRGSALESSQSPNPCWEPLHALPPCWPAQKEGYPCSETAALLNSEHVQRPLSLKKKLFFSTIVVLPFAFLLYTGTLALPDPPTLPAMSKTHGPGWRGQLFAVDPTLGFASVPNAQGAEILKIGPEVQVRFDEEGFRVPMAAADVAAVGAPRALALGCSHTFGAACLAEETYANNLSRVFGFRCVNAGIPSYGLSQVLILARRLIPRYKPDYVIVQYSPWLVERSQRLYASGALSGPSPLPISRNQPRTTCLDIHPPIFAEKATELPISGLS